MIPLNKIQVSTIQAPNNYINITIWLKQSCLQLNISKTEAMFFTRSNNHSGETNIFVAGEKIKVVYLGV